MLKTKQFKFGNNLQNALEGILRYLTLVMSIVKAKIKDIRDTKLCARLRF